MRAPMTEYLLIDLDTERWVWGASATSATPTATTSRAPLSTTAIPVRSTSPSSIRSATSSRSPRTRRTATHDSTAPAARRNWRPNTSRRATPPTVDMVFDIDALRRQWQERGVDPEAVFNYGPGEDAQKYTAQLKAAGHIR